MEGRRSGKQSQARANLQVSGMRVALVCCGWALDVLFICVMVMCHATYHAVALTLALCSNTEQHLQPLQAQEAEELQKIKDMKVQIDRVKANIMQNNMTIHSLLRGVVAGHRN